SLSSSILPPTVLPPRQTPTLPPYTPPFPSLPRPPRRNAAVFRVRPPGRPRRRGRTGRSPAARPPRRGRARSEAVHRRTRCEHRRSEEHTSELQSRFDLVCRLLLENKYTADS